MKTISKYIHRLALLIALFAICGEVVGQNYENGIDLETGKTKVSKDVPRKALVGPDCLINTMATIIGVGEDVQNLNNVLDHNLENAATIKSLVGLTAIENPFVIRVKDTKHVYEKGTSAGFCVQSSKSGLLSLDVLNLIHIGFYKQDKLIKDKQYFSTSCIMLRDCIKKRHKKEVLNLRGFHKKFHR